MGVEIDYSLDEVDEEGWDPWFAALLAGEALLHVGGALLMLLGEDGVLTGAIVGDMIMLIGLLALHALYPTTYHPATE